MEAADLGGGPFHVPIPILLRDTLQPRAQGGLTPDWGPHWSPALVLMEELLPSEPLFPLRQLLCWPP